MNSIKRLLVAVLIVTIVLSNTSFCVFADSDLSVEGITVINESAPTETVKGSGGFYTLSSKDGNNIAFINFDLSNVDVDSISSARLSIYMYSNKGSKYFSVSRVTKEWDPKTGEYELDSETTAANNECGLLKWSTRTADITELIKTCDTDMLTLCIRITSTFAPTSDGKIVIRIADENPTKIDLTFDEPPVISDYRIAGTFVEGFDVNAEYDFSSSQYGEGDSTVDWLCADDDMGTNEREAALDNGKSFTLTSEYVGKYIRARITPYADGGLYVKGGKKQPNVYCTDYVGPVKGASYLDELVSKIGEQCEDAAQLYDYLCDNEKFFNLGIDAVNNPPYDAYKNQILNNVLASEPDTYLNLSKTYKNELTAIDIQEADVSELGKILKNTSLNLDVYNSLADKGFFESALASEKFLSYEDLENKFDKICAAATVIEEKSAEKIPGLLDGCAEYLSENIESYSYGELLKAGEYFVSADKSGLTDFAGFDNLVTEALSYGRKNYFGGYLSAKKYFAGEAYIKTDYTDDVRGVNSAVPANVSYSLCGNTNSANYRQYAFLRLDLTDLLDYGIYSAKVNMYGTVGGGADKTIGIYESGKFTDSNDFVSRYPNGTDIEKGKNVGEMKFSFGTKKWNTVDITDFILEKKQQGVNEAYLILDYTDASIGMDVSKNGFVWSQSHGGDFAPYVEMVYETPPVVKNLSVRGVKAVGNTLTAKYDFYGCNAEKDSVFEWYKADKTGDSYSNIQRISGADTASLTLDGTLAGKCIMVKVKPKTAAGQHAEGEYCSSPYTVPVLSSDESCALVGKINSAQNDGELTLLLDNSDNKYHLDIDLAKDTEFLADASNVKKILITKDFDDLKSFVKYYRDMIEVQHINETAYDDLNKVLTECTIDILLERYNDFEDKTSVHNAVYNKGFESVEAFVTAFNEACAVHEFAGVNHSNVVGLIKAYDFMFDEDIKAFDSDKLELIGNIFMTASEGKKTSFADIKQAMTEAVNKANSYTPEIDSNPSASGSGRGGSSSVSVPSAGGSNPVVNPVEPAKVFNDIESVESWAGKQILKLYEMGVVCGDGSGTFRPNDSITREEFVKMVVSAFNIDGDNRAEFTDTDNNAWYSPYIGKAVSSGIINGMGNGEFGVGKNISREDMAVIVYRILSANNTVREKNAYISFDDSGEISTYALSAVSTLTREGILNGVGDNKFAPKSTATRAMVAVMICNALEHK